jgi:DNA polymerase I-like protein with 3'-5' exonuclease and polymerase domains
MYGAGPAKIAWQVTKDSRTNDPHAPEFTKRQAEEVIKDYFKRFKNLASWITREQEFIAQNGFTYSHFGRKRRLPNVASSDRATVGHTIRSGLNFLVQSNASDINLLAAIDMNNYIKEQGTGARIFALVHDSILAEVPENEVEQYTETLMGFIKLDRGLSIPGSPIGCDFEVGDDYAFGKYEKYEAEWDAANEV